MQDFLVSKHRLHEETPTSNSALLAAELRMSAPTARAALNHMIRLGILEEMSGKKRDKIYIYRNYLNILEEGAHPFSKVDHLY